MLPLIGIAGQAPLRLSGAVLDLAMVLSSALPAAAPGQDVLQRTGHAVLRQPKRGLWRSGYEERCRREVKDYVAGLRRYAECVRKQALEGEARAESVVERFACMERGEDDCR